ncbi:MAG: 3,2-trans-enoyl-CoA isomerase [Lysobacterales bacterium]|jgi:3,2-trans-enoyl-CoA isomerase
MLIDQIHHGDVLELNMQRPPVNALNPELVGEMIQAVLDAPQTSKALVISGREGLFSAGLDVRELMQLNRQEMTVFWREFFALLAAVARSPIPVAAAITGHAPAGGAVLSLFCDYRVMSDGNFKIGLNETRVGLVVPEVIRLALERLTGPHKAELLIVEGALITAEKALSCGMIDAIAQNPESTVADAIAWCEGLLDLPSHAMLGNRTLARRESCRQFDSVGEAEVASFVEGWFADDTQAVLQSVLDQLKNRSKTKA